MLDVIFQRTSCFRRLSVAVFSALFFSNLAADPADSAEHSRGEIPIAKRQQPGFDRCASHGEWYLGRSTIPLGISLPWSIPYFELTPQLGTGGGACVPQVEYMGGGRYCGQFSVLTEIKRWSPIIGDSVSVLAQVGKSLLPETCLSSDDPNGASRDDLAFWCGRLYGGGVLHNALSPQSRFLPRSTVRLGGLFEYGSLYYCYAEKWISSQGQGGPMASAGFRKCYPTACHLMGQLGIPLVRVAGKLRIAGARITNTKMVENDKGTEPCNLEQVKAYWWANLTTLGKLELAWSLPKCPWVDFAVQWWSFWLPTEAPNAALHASAWCPVRWPDLLQMAINPMPYLQVKFRARSLKDLKSLGGGVRFVWKASAKNPDWKSFWKVASVRSMEASLLEPMEPDLAQLARMQGE